MINHTFTTDEIIDRLEVLWRKLEDEGRYVSANTVQLALERIEELSHDVDIKPDMPSPPASFTVREAPELSSGLGDGIKQTQPDIKPAKKFQCAALVQGTAGGNYPSECDWPECGCDQ
jgi:hypothetical protein